MKKKNVKNEKKEKIIKVLNIVSYILSGLFIFVFILSMCKSCDNPQRQNAPKQALNNAISDTYIVSDYFNEDYPIAYRFSNEIYTFNEFVTTLNTLITNSTINYPGAKLVFIENNPLTDDVDGTINGWQYIVDFNTNELIAYEMPNSPSLFFRYPIQTIYDNEWLVSFTGNVTETLEINSLFSGLYRINRELSVYERLDFYFGGGYIFPINFNYSFDFNGKYTDFKSNYFEFSNITFTYNNGVVITNIFNDNYAIYEHYSTWKRGFYSLKSNGAYIFDVVINQREYNFLKQCTYHEGDNYSFRIDNVYQLVSNQNPNVLSFPVTDINIDYGQVRDYIFNFSFQSGGQMFNEWKYSIWLIESGVFGRYDWHVYYDDIEIMSTSTYPTDYDYNSLRYNGVFTTTMQLFDITTKRITFDFNNLVYIDNDNNNSGSSDKDLYDVFTLVSFTIASFLPFLDYMVFPGLTIGVLVMIPIVITVLLFVLSIFKR